jgi:predicted DNA-binding transcriptional regulator YafY
MGPALVSAMQKLVAALPETQRSSVERGAQRLLVTPAGWLGEPEPVELLPVLQQAVFGDRRLRLRYAPPGSAAGWRTVDPVGLVSADGRWYLLATHRGADRTYRVSRVQEAVVLDEPAALRPAGTLAELWAARRDRFRARFPGSPVRVRVRAERRDALVAAAVGVVAEAVDDDGWISLELTFADSTHAAGTLWSLLPDVAVLAPAELRDGLAGRATAAVAVLRDGR